MPLTLSAERFPASGGMAGKGARKLLGASSLDRLETVIREAGQNARDAGLPGASVAFHVSLRRLTPAQRDVLAGEVLAQPPQSTVSRNLLNTALSAPAPVLLEISDFGTRGLGGPTRADTAALPGERTDFINFIRNIGATSEGPVKGGTYGFGKTSFYLASQPATILVDSLAQGLSGSERRFIACHLGDEFTHDEKRFTGRHWWGEAEGSEFVEPLRGAAAAELAERLGLPPRGPDQTGTTIAVLAPDIDDLETAAAKIRETLLWYFWPQMVSTGGPPPMSFSLSIDGAPQIIPDPERTAPIELLVRAWRQLKSGGEATPIWCLRPRMHLGDLVIAKGFRGDRPALTEDSAIPRQLHHVALMRHVELVVRYEKGPVLPAGGVEWGGVFIASREEEVARAFAASEPPAHDDWSPANMEKGPAQTFVRMGLTRIKEAISRFVYPQSTAGTGAVDQPSLARAASVLGSLIPQTPRDPRSRSSSSQRGRRRRWTLQAPQFVSIQAKGEGVDATFEIAGFNHSDEPLRITALPGVVMEDELSADTELPDGGIVTVTAWETADGAIASTEASFVAPPHKSIQMRVRVHVPGLAVVGLSLEAED